MITLLKCEMKKSKGKYILLSALAIIVFELIWMFYGVKYAQTDGWIRFLYQLPLIHTIFLPLAAMFISSRLNDIEHRGQMFKYLNCLMSKGKLYDIKLLYGLILFLFCISAEFIAVISFGFMMHFRDAFSGSLFLTCYLFTIVPAALLYVFQHTLSVIYRNQAVAFLAGIIGEFTGLFSLYLPWDVFRKIILWGHFGELQLVGMYWDSATRIADFYLLRPNYFFFITEFILIALLYAAGKKIFCEREG